MEKDVTEDSKKICQGVKEMIGNGLRPPNFTLQHLSDVLRGNGCIHCKPPCQVSQLLNLCNQSLTNIL